VSWNWTLFSNQAWRLLNLKNDAKTERIKAQTHTQKTNEFQNLDWRFSEK
jgi:hypothetical protein